MERSARRLLMRQRSQLMPAGGPERTDVLTGSAGPNASNGGIFLQRKKRGGRWLFATSSLHFTPPSGADLVFTVVAPSKAIAGAVRLAQSDGDLAAHLAIGERILALRSIPGVSLASYTAPDDPFIAHAWLSEVVFAFVYRLGGLPLLAVLTALVIASTHALVVVFLRRQGADPRWALLAGVVSLALAASHWLTRPHMFSILAAFLTVFLLETRPRHLLLTVAAVFAIWANLHGAWLFGLLLIGMYAAGELLEWRISGDAKHRLRALAFARAFAIAAAATLLNPYGPLLHVEVFQAVTSPLLSANIDEYLPPDFRELSNLPFLLGLILTVAVLALSPTRIPLPGLFVVVVGAFLALRSSRNIALFGVTAWPLVALHAAQSWSGRGWNPPIFREFARIDARTRTGLWSAIVALLLLALGLNHGRVAGATLIRDEFDSRRFPVEAVARARSAGMDGRVFHPWVWGGYLVREWPEARIHVDPLEFNATTIDSYTRIDALRPGWQAELDKWSVGTALVRADAPLATALRADTNWSRWYADETAIVFVRRSSPDVTAVPAAP